MSGNDTTAAVPRQPQSLDGATVERSAAARQAWRDSLRTGAPLTGAALGEMFDRSPRWGRQRIAEARQTAATNGSHEPAMGTSDRRSGPPQPGGRSGNGRATADGGEEAGTGRHNGTGNPVKATAAADLGCRNGTGSRSRNGSEDAPEEGSGSRSREPDPLVPGAGWEDKVTWAAVAVVTVAAAVASVDHLAELARLAGITGMRVWLLPAAIDGLATAATLRLRQAHRFNCRPGALPWGALLVGLAASVMGNVLAVHPSLVPTDVLKIAVGATPPVSLALGLHLALHQPQVTRIQE